MRVVRTSLAVLAVAGSAGLLAAAPVSAAAPPAQVTVVHGLRGLVADIWLDDKKVLPSFQPERATDPLPIPAGKHQIDIRSEGAALSDKPLLSQQVNIPAGADLSVIAHLNATGQPSLSVFREDVVTVPAGRSRVTVRHAAATSDIGVQLNSKPIGAEVAPGAQASRDVAPGTYAVSVSAAAATAATPLLAPQDVPLREGSGMVLYLIGSQDSRTLSWLAQPVRARATLPNKIASGDSGLRTSTDGLPRSAAAAFALVLLSALFVVRRGNDALMFGRLPGGSGLVLRLASVVCLTSGCAAQGMSAAAEPVTTQSVQSEAAAVNTPAPASAVLAPVSPASESALASAQKPMPNTSSATPDASVAPSVAKPIESATAPIKTRPLKLSDLPKAPAGPAKITIDRLKVRAPIVAVSSTDSGELDVPAADLVGWYQHAAVPGAGRGTIVLAAHVDFRGVRGVFFDLVTLRKGDVIGVTHAGAEHRYRVTSNKSVPKASIGTAGVFDSAGPEQLVLVTCGGTFDRAARSYRDNIVVHAVPV